MKGAKELFDEIGSAIKDSAEQTEEIIAHRQKQNRFISRDDLLKKLEEEQNDAPDSDREQGKK